MTERIERRRALLAGLGATGAAEAELLDYLRDHYQGLAGTREDAEEPQVAAWRSYVEEGARDGVARALRRRFPQLGFRVAGGISQTNEYRAATRRGEFDPEGPVVLPLERPDRLELRLDAGIAGPVPVLIARHRPDFVALVRALTARNEPEVVPDAMGACLVKGLADWERVAGYRRAWERRLGRAASAEEWASEMAANLAPRKELWQDRLILLSDGPYSAVPAAEIGLDETEWRERSLAIRLAHESFHYLTLRRAGSIRSHLLDELVADYAGLSAAFGRYEPRLALRFLGLDRLPEIRPEGRLAVYRGSLSDAAVAVLARLLERAADALAALPPLTEAATRRQATRLLELAAAGLDGIAAGAVGAPE